MSKDIQAMNFDRVDESLTRSGLPTSNDLRVLKEKYGVKTLVNFCTKANVEEEKAQAEALGLNYKHLPWSAHFYNIFSPSYYNNVAKKFLSIMDDGDNHPVHLHCFHGRERTGMMVSIYRFHKYNYSFFQVLQEMQQYKFKAHLHFTLVLYLFLYRMSNF